MMCQAALEARSELPVWYRAEAWNFLFDPFDPYFIRQAFKVNQKKTTILGCLIWGRQEWLLISGNEGTFDDPLSLYYQSQGECPSFSMHTSTSTHRLNLTLLYIRPARLPHLAKARSLYRRGHSRRSPCPYSGILLRPCYEADMVGHSTPSDKLPP